MSINRELSQFGRLVEITDGGYVGIGTNSNVSIGFSTITVNTITATTFYCIFYRIKLINTLIEKKNHGKKGT
jgi:hypothetical protein